MVNCIELFFLLNELMKFKLMGLIGFYYFILVVYYDFVDIFVFLNGNDFENCGFDI